MVWIFPAETDDALAPSDEADLPDPRKRRAVRERNDGGKRDPFILNRFEKILAMAEMVNVGRPSDSTLRTGFPPAGTITAF
jgi:nitric oxide reductase NorD protein